ncbi:Epoxide hydrolase, putative [Penicillium digitatum PHI26]|uniref:Epoxide hydrolase, putative n=2 Tax=Penicillium digitatum TaxID=36651 RepID=K9GTU1_PEND2|nr:Epoxide hydrolase, putative [Penicillium digitatum Pd1]EKV16038.1 Epoxide hydrolase, putative [Penicillium digitatum Pd1]EKV18033.1 Epoxide hydrolase, putative [Penicillium digitatum PHI26]
MPIDKIQVSGDSRIEYKTATLNGYNYSYILSQPKSGQFKATVFLIHGFPDLSMGWRYQIPMLVDMGFRVVAPDCLGYGRTDAPDDFTAYALKRCAADIKALATHLGETQIILGGHDWGAGLAYRIALWHPELVSHLFTVCVHYVRPTAKYFLMEDLIRDVTPNFAYQLQFKSGEVEKVVRSKDEIRQFLLALYGGRTEAGESGFDAYKGVLLDKLGELKLSRLLSEEELEFYTNEFVRNGIHGPLNWYRTRDVNFEDELAVLDREIQIPTLFIQALRDQALPPHLAKSMAKQLPRLTLKQVDSSHWALWEKPEEVNTIIGTWLKDQSVANEVSGKL